MERAIYYWLPGFKPCKYWKAICMVLQMNCRLASILDDFNFPWDWRMKGTVINCPSPSSFLNYTHPYLRFECFLQSIMQLGAAHCNCKPGASARFLQRTGINVRECSGMFWKFQKAEHNLLGGSERWKIKARVELVKHFCTLNISTSVLLLPRVKLFASFFTVKFISLDLRALTVKSWGSWRMSLGMFPETSSTN